MNFANEMKTTEIYS